MHLTNEPLTKFTAIGKDHGGIYLIDYEILAVDFTEVQELFLKEHPTYIYLACCRTDKTKSLTLYREITTRADKHYSIQDNSPDLRLNINEGVYERIAMFSPKEPPFEKVTDITMESIGILKKQYSDLSDTVKRLLPRHQQELLEDIIEKAKTLDYLLVDPNDRRMDLNLKGHYPIPFYITSGSLDNYYAPDENSGMNAIREIRANERLYSLISQKAEFEERYFYILAPDLELRKEQVRRIKECILSETPYEPDHPNIFLTEPSKCQTYHLSVIFHNGIPVFFE